MRLINYLCLRVRENISFILGSAGIEKTKISKSNIKEIVGIGHRLQLKKYLLQRHRLRSISGPGSFSGRADLLHCFLSVESCMPQRTCTVGSDGRDSTNQSGLDTACSNALLVLMISKITGGPEV